MNKIILDFSGNDGSKNRVSCFYRYGMFSLLLYFTIVLICFFWTAWKSGRAFLGFVFILGRISSSLKHHCQ